MNALHSKVADFDLLREALEFVAAIRTQQQQLIDLTFGRLLQQRQAASSVLHNIPVDFLGEPIGNIFIIKKTLTAK